MIELENLLRVAVEREASDILIIGGLNPTFRRSGAIIHTGEERLLPPDTQRLLEQTYAQSVKLLQDHRQLLDEISEFLLVKETITGEELMRFVNAENEPKLPQTQPEQAEDQDVL